MNKFLKLFFLSLSISSCTEIYKRPNEFISYDGFPDTAVNLAFVNSEYDDYNSAQKGEGDRGAFVFSSNRNSKGTNFDIIQYSQLSWYFDFEDGETTLTVDTVFDYEASTIKDMLLKINTQKNEFGPYMFEIDHGFEFLLFYAQEDSDKLNLKFMAYKIDSVKGYNHYLEVDGPYNVDVVNTDNSNEAYISIDDNFIYYCSDKTGNFDVYQYPMNLLISRADECIDFLTEKPTQKAIPVAAINSAFEDKCPYVVNNFMVFTSNRPGGFGGYDLWYCQLKDGKWSEPENFGPAINSKYDEYRPIVKKAIPNDLMIFSSNRPGGKGGFDLYYAGVNRNENW